MTTLLKYWKPILVIVALVTVTALAHTNGKLGERKKWEAKIQKERLELSESARKQERANALKIAQIDKEGVDKLKELEHEKKQYYC